MHINKHTHPTEHSNLTLSHGVLGEYILVENGLNKWLKNMNGTKYQPKVCKFEVQFFSTNNMIPAAFEP